MGMSPQSTRNEVSLVSESLLMDSSGLEIKTKTAHPSLVVYRSRSTVYIRHLQESGETVNDN